VIAPKILAIALPLLLAAVIISKALQLIS